MTTHHDGSLKVVSEKIECNRRSNRGADNAESNLRWPTRGPGLLASVSLLVWLASAISGRAIIFYSTADAEHNTSAPSGQLANSGWEYQGLWGDYLGTAIAPRYFVSAKHIGGNVGDKFVLNGVAYTTTAVFDNPNGDLRIWRIEGQFPSHAQIYSGTDEAGKHLIVFGRGTQRGDEIKIGGLLSSELKGWRWGTQDGRKRWGENRVESVSNVSGAGDLLRVTFDSNGERNEAHLSYGDSGGAIFMNDGSGWKLAGINYAVDGPYNTSNSGEGFQAAIFDEGGLYRRVNGVWTPTPDLPVAQPGAFYGTRISSHIAWINSVISQSAPPPVPSASPTLQSAASSLGNYSDEPTAKVNESTRSITLSLPNGLRFYRISAPSQLRISTIKVQSGSLVLSYE
jgi:hypothetical protein